MDFTIKTEQLVLRQPSVDDAFELFRLMSDSSITHYLTWEPHTDIETTKAVVKSLIDSQSNDKGYHWCTCLDNEIIGLVSLIDVRRKIRTWTFNRAELSYWIGTQFQGKGYATEASKAILEFGFGKLGLHKIIVAHSTENTQSKSICLKLHFTPYAHERDAFCKNNKWHDLIWYEMIKKSRENK